MTILGMNVPTKKAGKVCFRNDERAVSGPPNSLLWKGGVRISCVFSCCLSRGGLRLKQKPYGKICMN